MLFQRLLCLETKSLIPLISVAVQNERFAWIIFFSEVRDALLKYNTTLSVFKVIFYKCIMRPQAMVFFCQKKLSVAWECHLTQWHVQLIVCLITSVLSCLHIFWKFFSDCEWFGHYFLTAGSNILLSLWGYPFHDSSTLMSFLFFTLRSNLEPNISFILSPNIYHI